MNKQTNRHRNARDGALARACADAIARPSATPRRSRVVVIGLRGVPDVIGGIERHCELLYPALDSAAPDIEFCMIARRSYTQASVYNFRGIKVRALWAPRSGVLETLVHTPLALLYAALWLRPQVVQLHGIGPGFFAPLARLLGTRVVVTHHAADFLRPKWGLPGRLFLRTGERLSAYFADRIVCVSETLRAEFVGRHPAAAGRAVAIRHGTQLEPVTPAESAALLAALGLERGRYLLAVGRLDETKRFEDLLAAHARLDPGAMPLVIAGSSNADSGYEAALKAATGRGVHFVGFQTGSALSALFEGAALLLHPSSMEGFGLVILEGLSMGAQVSVSDIPVHREFGLPEASFFPVEDIAAIERAMASAAPRDRPWPPAGAIASRHSMSQSVDAHHAMFRSLLSETPSRRARRSNSAQ